jgi:hypothetical protein
MKGRWPAETNEARKYLKQVCVVGRGCSHWVMSDRFSTEDEIEKKDFMEQPEGTQEHGIHQN